MNNPYELVKNILQSDTTNDKPLSSRTPLPALTYTVLPSAEKKKAMTSATASISRTRAAAGISHSTAYFPTRSAQTRPQVPPESADLRGCPSALWTY